PEALELIALQRDQFKRLGVFADWEHPYLTLSREYEAEIVRSFGKLVKGGYIHKGLKPVNWCCTCETALAEAEVEYDNHTSPSVYVKFRVTSHQSPATSQKNVFFVIWTTTPWTLLANVAIAVHPHQQYAFVAVRDEIWVMMEERVAAAMEKFGIKEYSIVERKSGTGLDGMVCRHPFIERDSPVVQAEYVSAADGTGCVHTAPGHGQDDYATGRRYKLPVLMPVDPKGNFDKSAGEFTGMNVHKAHKPIIEKLAAAGALIFSESITHSYPHCWRCKEPIIFRATPQWFLTMDHQGLRGKLLQTINKDVAWVPPYGRERIRSMVESRPDWCLSRQRLWGVPIIAFYCKACDHEVLDAGIIDRVADLVAKDGVEVWFSTAEKDLLPPGFVCAKCGGNNFRRELDIMDVWFDSGVSHQAVLKKRDHLGFPADLYLEGSDQHRGWFQSSLITAMGIEGIAPFKSVLTHGFVVDGDGRKMSKSVGNVVSPHEVIKDYGADILRLWVASSDYSEDIRVSPQILTRLADAYRKIRNTYRYMIGNLFDFDPARDAVAPAEMLEIDRWALSETYKLVEAVSRHYDEYSFHQVFHEVYHFCVIQLSSFYLDILKDRLYIPHAKSLPRRSGQTALSIMLDVLTKLMAPITVFTADEAWQNMAKGQPALSVHQALWPDLAALKKYHDPALEDVWKRIIDVRGEVLKALEIKREAGLLGSGLEAQVTLFSTESALQGLLTRYQGELPSVLIVSKVAIGDGELADAQRSATVPLQIKVEKASGAKCQRCWNYNVYAKEGDQHAALCERCAAIVRGGPG
ncbi:MAG: isoleucine--tRNA ligase, partial [Candidatus Omnitrophota bacterium]